MDSQPALCEKLIGMCYRAMIPDMDMDVENSSTLPCLGTNWVDVRSGILTFLVGFVVVVSGRALQIRQEVIRICDREEHPPTGQVLDIRVSPQTKPTVAFAVKIATLFMRCVSPAVVADNASWNRDVRQIVNICMEAYKNKTDASAMA